MKLWRPALGIWEGVDGSLFKISQIQIQRKQNGPRQLHKKNPHRFDVQIK